MAKSKVYGVTELRKALSGDFPKKLRNNLVTQMEKSANALVNDLKARAPVYTGNQTVRTWKGKEYPIIKGALRDSIGWTWGEAPDGAMVLGSGPDNEGMKITIYAGGGPLDVFYHRWVEFGTADWAGSPFFFGTYRDHKRRIRGGITRQLKKTIKEVMA